MISAHQQKLTELKSDFMDFYIRWPGEQRKLGDAINYIQTLLAKHLNMATTMFLKRSADVYVPIEEASLSCDIAKSIVTHFDQLFIETPSALRQEPLFEQMTHMLHCKVEGKEPIGIFLFQQSSTHPYFNDVEFAEEFRLLLSETLQVYNEHIRVQQKASQYRKLYDIANLFHSTMDVDTILQNVLMIVQENFPNAKTELIMSNNQDQKMKKNIKLFDYLSERATTVEAFLSGNMTTEHMANNRGLLINVPIKGQQAIYGVLQVAVSKGSSLNETDQEFLQVLAQASGNALENAKLYHQSSRLISDLQLLNETSHRLNMRLDIDEMLQFLQKQLVKSFQPMELCFFFKVEDQFQTTVACTPLFKTIHGDIYVEHAKRHFSHSQDPLFIADFRRVESAHNIIYKSMMAIPMLVEERIQGFSMVLHKDPYFFSFDSFKLMQSLIHHSSLALANSKLRHQLQEMVERDHLTNLYARGYLDNYVEKSLQMDRGGMFLLIDIDNFKQINDTYGHQTGDHILKQIGHHLERVVDDKGICARWGGEEMAIYSANLSEEIGLELAQTLVRTIPQVTNPSVTISAGLVMWHKKQRPEFKALFLHADTALYSAKNSGKNRFCVFDKSMQLQH